jgi:hypothetical protein
MGGYGSGRKYWSSRLVKEEGLTLNGFQILPEAFKVRNGGNSDTGIITWSRNGESYARIGYSFNGQTFILDYSRNDEPLKYPVSITSTIQPKGGLRYWFICPLANCGRRTAKLYLPAGHKYFGCRKCYNLTYQSSNESHKWDGMFRRLAWQTGRSFRDVKKAMNEDR